MAASRASCGRVRAALCGGQQGVSEAPRRHAESDPKLKRAHHKVLTLPVQLSRSSRPLLSLTKYPLDGERDGDHRGGGCDARRRVGQDGG